MSKVFLHPKNPINPINHASFLIVRTDRLGDVVLTLPMASAIKKASPNARVVFLAREYTRPIVERSTGIDQVLCIEDGIGLLRLIRLMRKANANVVLLPSPRFPLALAAFLARIPIRVSTGYRWYSFLFNRRIFEHRKTAERHESEYNLRMLSTIGIKADENAVAEIRLRSEEISSVEYWLKENLGSEQPKYIVLHAVSGGSTNEWAPERFIELTKILQERINCDIVLTGIESDRAKLSAICEEIHTHLYIGKSIAELAELLANAAAVVSVGTGPGHLSSALGTPTVGLFPLPKPISKERWGFRGRFVISLAPPPIANCPDCKSCTCMERIDAFRVADEIEKLILMRND